jgi:hypothetical protein
MGQINPFTGMNSVLASVPKRWLNAVVHASNYLEGDGDLHSVGIALYSSDGGTVTYRDMYDTAVTQVLSPGVILPTSVIRVTAFSGTNLDVAFLTGPLT